MSTGKHGGLVVAVGGSMVIVSVLALALAGVLNFLRFDETYMRLVAQRLDVTAQDIGRLVALGLDLGLPIESQGNLPATLRHHLSVNPDLRAVSVHACDGGAVVGEARGAPAAEPWRDHLGKPSWFVVGAGGISVGISVAGPLGTCGAGIAITQSADGYLAAVSDVRRRFLTVGLAAAGAAAAAMAFAALVFGRRRRILGEADDDLARLLAGKGGEPPPSLDPDAAAEGWERDVVEAYLAARPVIAACAAGRRGGSVP